MAGGGSDGSGGAGGGGEGGGGEGGGGEGGGGEGEGGGGEGEGGGGEGGGGEGGSEGGGEGGGAPAIVVVTTGAAATLSRGLPNAASARVASDSSAVSALTRASAPAELGLGLGLGVGIQVGVVAGVGVGLGLAAGVGAGVGVARTGRVRRDDHTVDPHARGQGGQRDLGGGDAELGRELGCNLAGGGGGVEVRYTAGQYEGEGYADAIGGARCQRWRAWGWRRGRG